MAVEVAILTALNTHLKDLVFSPVIPVAWANKSFPVPKDETGKPMPYLRPTLLRGTASVIALPNVGMNQFPGIYQVDVFYPLNGGEDGPTQIAMAVADHFAHGLAIYQDDFVIRVMQPPALLPIQPESELIMLPVRITWRTYARNS